MKGSSHRDRGLKAVRHLSLNLRTRSKRAEVAQLVERLLAKEKGASSNLVFRSSVFEGQGKPKENQTNKEAKMEFAHLPLQEEMEFLAGSYWISGEDKIPYKGREVLCLVRDAGPFTTCGTGGCRQFPGFRSILIPGFVIRHRYKKNEDGLEISEVEPIRHEDAKKDLGQIVQDRYSTPQIEFL